MTQFSHSLVALPLLAAALLAGCGGGGSGTALQPQQSQQSPSIAVGEPSPNTRLDTTEFVAMARSAGCTDLRNRLFVIDEKQVLWDRAGNCADNGYAQVLFGTTAKTALCSESDSIAGPRTTCSDEKFRDQLATMIKNLDKADLGLGAGHTVRAVDFLPANGSLLSYESVSNGSHSSVVAAKNVVIKDKAAWARLWTDTHRNVITEPALPEIDFASKMVIGVYQGEQPNGCHFTRITKVAVASDKLVVNYSDHDDLRAMLCMQAITSPYHLVTVKRSDVPVEFANITANKLYFQDVDRRVITGINWDAPQNFVIKNEQNWAGLWSQYAPGEKLPVVDFNKFMVIGVFMGIQPNACASSEIVNVDRSGGTINVTVRQGTPGPTTMCAMGMTAPSHLVMVERVEGTVEFAFDRYAL